MAKSYRDRAMSPREKREAAIILGLSLFVFGVMVKYRSVKTVPALPTNKTLTDKRRYKKKQTTNTCSYCGGRIYTPPKKIYIWN